jgi:hypothetical protein
MSFPPLRGFHLFPALETPEWLQQSVSCRTRVEFDNFETGGSELISIQEHACLPLPVRLRVHINELM